MNISRPACIGNTVEASKVRKNRKIFALKSSFYHIVLTVQPRLDETSATQIAVQ